MCGVCTWDMVECVSIMSALVFHHERLLSVVNKLLQYNTKAHELHSPFPVIRTSGPNHSQWSSSQRVKSLILQVKYLYFDNQNFRESCEWEEEREGVEVGRNGRQFAY